VVNLTEGYRRPLDCSWGGSRRFNLAKRTKECWQSPSSGTLRTLNAYSFSHAMPGQADGQR
jgi:hypothetical protein